MSITDADCRSCGACCVSASDTSELSYGYADLTDKDIEQLSTRVRKQLHEIVVCEETRYATRAKQLPSGSYACQYLRGTPGKRCSCTIYDTRPEICRHFQVGGALCRAARLDLDLTRPRKDT